MQLADAAARLAVLLPRDRDRPLNTPDRLVEFQRDRLVQVDAALGGAVRPARRPLVQHIGKQVAECRRVVAVHADREVESLETERLRAGVWVEAHAGAIVLLPALRVAQRLVGFGDLPELCRRQPVTRVDVRMEFASQPFIGPLDVSLRRPPIDAQDQIEVHGRISD